MMDAATPHPEPDQDRDAEAIDLGVLREHRRPPPRLPLHLFRGFWSDWIGAAADAAASPPDYVAAPLLAAASAVIGNARWIGVHDGWREPPHVWAASVGYSGGSKSPGADPVLHHLVAAVERQMRQGHPDRHGEWLAAATIAKARKATWEDQVKAAQKKGNPPPPMPDDMEAPPEPRPPVLRCNDVTHECVADLLANAAPRGLMMVRDELAGWLLGMNSYSDAARPFWLEAYGGRPYRVDRRKLGGQPIQVRHNAVSWWGGIQPSRLAETMVEADDGLLARFIWTWPEPVPFRLPRRQPGPEAATAAFLRLAALDMRPGEDGPEPIVIPLAAAALPDMEAFAQDMQARQESAPGLMQSAYGKARGLAARLALVLEHLWWSGEGGMKAPPERVSGTAFLAAVVLVQDYILPSAERVYGDAAVPPRDRDAATLARWIVSTRAPEVYVRDVLRRRVLPDADKVKAAAAALLDAGWLIHAERDIGPGRARVAWPVNPALWPALEQARFSAPPTA